MTGIIGYGLTTALVAAVAIGSLEELGQQVALALQTVANALRIAGGGP